MRSSSSGEEGTAEKCDEVTKSQFPTPISHCRGGGREIKRKLSARKGEGWREDFKIWFLRFGFVFSLTYSDFIDNKFN